MNYDQSKTLLGYLESVVTSLAQLVVIQQRRLETESKYMTIDDSILQEVVNAFNTALLAESDDKAAMAAKDATIASLEAKLAPNPALLASIKTVLANALVANPTPPPAAPPAP